MLTEIYDPLGGEMFQIMEQTGKIVNEKYMPEISDELILKMYRTMMLSRIQDEKSLQYQRQGRMLTFAPSMGQEGIQVASVAAIEKKDWVVSAFRENATWLWLGQPMENLFLYWIGSEEGSRIPEGVNLLPVVVPIGTQFNHAVGIGMSMKYKKNDSVVVSFIGDGGTSEGEFYEAINYAGAMNTPNIFIIQNNQFAISTPRSLQTKAKTLAQKGIAAGIPCIQIDGNDIFAVYATVKEAVERGRKGEGPTLIEAVTYRMGPHTTADDPTIYRKEEYHQKMLKTDPLIRTKNYMITKGIWDEDKESSLKEELQNLVEETFKKIEKTDNTPLEDIFKYTYENMTENLKEQYEEYKTYLEEGGK
jgi:pyruvate dehydrogenase E1 component alpha subunit